MSDFDGCLVDTEAAVRAAYEEALGRLFTDEHWSYVWGQPWNVWCSRSVKDRKDELYPKHVGKVELTPFGNRMLDLVVLTGASWRSVDLVARQLDLENVPVLGCEKTAGQKRQILCKLRHPDDTEQPPGVYFDDNLDVGQAICQDTRFVFCHVQGNVVAVHIPDTLTTEEGEDAWTQLSLLLALMNVCRG